MYLRECITLEQVVNAINNDNRGFGELGPDELAGLHAVEEARKSGALADYEYWPPLAAHLDSLVEAGANFNWGEAIEFSLRQLALPRDTDKLAAEQHKKAIDFCKGLCKNLRPPWII